MSTFVVAELSANHGNDINIVKQSIKKAKEIGCDAMKIQTFRPESITIDCDKEYFRLNSGTIWDGETLYNLYTGTYLPWEWHEEIFEYARSIDMMLFSSPFDCAAVDLLEKCGNPIYKIASYEITDLNLIRYAAKTGKPIVMSTGIATEEEIQRAVDTCRAANNNDITLLQCTSEYPAKIEDANLATMVDMQKKFGVKVGVSDHSLENVVVTTGVAMGATMIEKHFTLDRSIGGADASFSLDVEQFTKLVQDIRKVEKVMGKVDYSLTPKRQKNRLYARSLFVVKDVAKGDTITEENVRSIRPANGLSPMYYDDVMGKKFVQDVTMGTPLSFDIIEEFDHQ